MYNSRTRYPKDLTGFRFRMLTVKRLARPEECTESQLRSRDQKWFCQCDCGTTMVTIRNNLISGGVGSCGCSRRGGRPLTASTIVPQAVVDPQVHQRLRDIWAGVRGRCYSPYSATYAQYGGRGIRMSGDWIDNFEEFEKWAIKNGYQVGMSLDRIDPNGNYSAENCRWVTMKEQQLNKRTTVRTENGTPLRTLCLEHNVSDSTVRARLKQGWSLNEALTAKVTRKYYYGGRSLDELALMVGSQASSIRAHRTRHGGTVKEILIYFAKRNGFGDRVAWIEANVPDERDSGFRYPRPALITAEIKKEKEKAEIAALIEADLAQADAELLEQLHDHTKRLLGEEE